jgi:hypothetical protein
MVYCLLQPDMISTYEVYTQVFSPNHCCCGKATVIAYSEWVFVALIIHRPKRMHRILLSFTACLAHAIFFHVISQSPLF